MVIVYEFGVYTEADAGGGGTEVVVDDLINAQRMPVAVLTDLAEQEMVNELHFAARLGSQEEHGAEMSGATSRLWRACLKQRTQGAWLPSESARPSSSEVPGWLRKYSRCHHLAEVCSREIGRVVGRTDDDEATVGADVVDAVEDGDAFRPRAEFVVADRLRTSSRASQGS